MNVPPLLHRTRRRRVLRAPQPLVVRAHPVGACTANSCHPLTAFSVAFCAHQRFTGRRP